MESAREDLLPAASDPWQSVVAGYTEPKRRPLLSFMRHFPLRVCSVWISGCVLGASIAVALLFGVSSEQAPSAQPSPLQCAGACTSGRSKYLDGVFTGVGSMTLSAFGVTYTYTWTVSDVFNTTSGLATTTFKAVENPFPHPLHDFACVDALFNVSDNCRVLVDMAGQPELCGNRGSGAATTLQWDGVDTILLTTSLPGPLGTTTTETRMTRVPLQHVQPITSDGSILPAWRGNVLRSRRLFGRT